MASQKISSFNVSTSLNDSDLFTLVVNSTNKNITFASFKSDLGVTGSLTAIGDPLSVPVLSSPSPQDYQIRSIESGNGIIASVSAQNGIAIESNFAQSSTGAKLIPDLNSPQYQIKTLLSGEGITLNDDGEVITIGATGVAVPSNLRFIGEEADFDNQTATTITLDPAIFYRIGASFSTAKNFVSQGTIMAGLNSAAVLTYTGTGSMFTVSTNRMTIRDLVIDCPNATAFKYAGDDTGDVNQRYNLESTVILNCNKVLESIGAGGHVFDLIQVENMTGSVGFSFSGSTPALAFNFTRILLEGMTAGSVGYDFGSVITNEVAIANNAMTGDATAIAISGLPNSGNIVAGHLATVVNCNFTALTNQLSGITVDDVRWGFIGNSGLPDSTSDALIYSSPNALETVISSVGVPVKVNAVFTTDSVGRFTADSTGRLTYIGEVDSRLPIDVSSTILGASGGDKQGTLSIAVNGVVLVPTTKQSTFSGADAASVTTIWQYDFSNGDYIEVFVSNETNTINIIVEQIVLRVN